MVKLSKSIVQAEGGFGAGVRQIVFVVAFFFRRFKDRASVKVEPQSLQGRDQRRCDGSIERIVAVISMKCC